ncbi:MAG: RNA-directed DNA polymerase, partial [Sulfurovaceae bacterium]|nr:RNA-directed DNA polymerase [Sulfurovaceae bacterium]
MFSFREIYDAYLRCRRRKRNTINALAFESNLIENICDLETSLNRGEYLPKRSVCFLTSSPKLREVFTADFSDRVVHHVVVPLLEQIYEPKFIHDSYSNRKGKGIHSAKERAEYFMRGSKYYLQLDVRNFFYSIDKNILFSKLKSEIINNYHQKVGDTKIEMHEMLRLIYVITFQDVTKNVIIKGDKKIFKNIPPHKTLFSIPKDKGLPIGNLTSQFFANVYMNDFDNFVKRKLKCKRYLRYVDDFVLFGETKEELLNHYKSIVEY